MEFGKWLKENRKTADISQEALAALASGYGGSVTGAYISNLERSYDTNKVGKPIRPSEQIVDAIALALNRSIDEARLAAGYAPTNPSDDHDVGPEISIRFANVNLTDEEKEKILSLTRTITAGVRNLRNQRLKSGGLS